MGILDAPPKIPYTVVKAGSASDLVAKVASVTGGTIFVPAGTYVVSATLSIKSGVTLMGEGEKTVIKLANGSTTVNPIIAVGSVGGATVSDVAIRNLKIDGNKANQTTLCIGIDVVTGLRVLVTGCHVDAVNGYNFHSSIGSAEVAFIGNVSTNSYKEGFEVEGGSRITFADNIVENAGYCGIYAWADTAGGGTCKDIVITGNTVRNYAQSAASSGIAVDDGATNVTVTGNTVSGGANGGTGIKIGSSTATAVSNVTVTGNTVESAPADGIAVSGRAVSVALGQNIVSSSGTNGIEVSGADVSGVTLNGNHVTGSTNAGIYVNGQAVEVSLTGNRVKGNAQAGIWLDQIVGASVVGNTVVGNSPAGTGYPGIQWTGTISGAGGGQGVVNSNRVVGNGSDGIYLRDQSDLLVSGNYCANNGQRTTSRAGIWLHASTIPIDSIFVLGNRSTDKQATKTQYYGIFLQSTGPTNVVISQNAVKGNATNDPNSGGIGFSSSNSYDSAPWHRLAGNTIGTTQVAVAHGLPYAPKSVSISMTSAGQVWQSATADTTNVYLTADAAGRTCDLTVG